MARRSALSALLMSVGRGAAYYVGREAARAITGRVKTKLNGNGTADRAVLALPEGMKEANYRVETPTAKPALPAGYQPSLSKVIAAGRSYGLVGEEGNLMLLTIGAINRMAIGIEGRSGSGKSRIADTFMQLLQPGQAYSLQLSSKKALVYDASAVNRADVVYLPELQQAMRNNPVVLEIGKRLAEGNDSVSTVYDPVSRKTIDIKINKGKALIFTKATENSYDPGVEFYRRTLILATDDSPEQTKRIIKETARGRRSEISPEELEQLKLHISGCFKDTSDPYNPFADAVTDHVDFSDLLNRSKFAHYQRLVKGFTRFHHPPRINDEQGNPISNLEDAMNAWMFNPIDWKPVWEQGLQTMRAAYPQQVDEWADKQVRNGYVVGSNPITGQLEDIVKVT